MYPNSIEDTERIRLKKLILDIVGDNLRTVTAIEDFSEHSPGKSAQILADIEQIRTEAERGNL